MKKRSELIQGLIDGTLSVEDKIIALNHTIVMREVEHIRSLQKEDKPKIIKRRKLNG